jgi:hypothetical protein
VRRWPFAGLVLLVVIGLLLAPFVVYGQSDLTTNLVSCWTLEEASGTRNDSVGSNHLTDNNTVGQAAGTVGNAGQFVAANLEYLSITDNASLSVGDIDFEFVGWVYLDSKTTDRAILGKWSGTEFEYVLQYNQPTDRFQFVVRKADNSGSVTASASTFGSPSTATWYFVDVYHDATNDVIAIAINNGSFNTTAITGGVKDGTATFRTGRQDGSTYWDGRIDEVVFWKRLISGADRTWLYNSGSGRSCAAIVATAATPTPTSSSTPTITPSPTYTPSPTLTPTRQFILATRPADPEIGTMVGFSYDLIEGLSLIFWIIPGLGVGAGVIFITMRLLKEKIQT